MSLENLKIALKKEKVIVGTKRTIKKLKEGKTREVYVSSNCPDYLKKQLSNYSEISGAKYIELTENSEELGAICKKPFSINCCCF